MTGLSPTPPEADVQALAEDREMHLAEHVLHGLIPSWEQVAFCREQDSPAWRESLAIARAVLAAGYRPAPEPTDQTREQIAEVLAEHPGYTSEVNEERSDEFAAYWEYRCSGPRCRELFPSGGFADQKHRAHQAAALATRLAVHVSPETAEERERIAKAMTALADEWDAKGDALWDKWPGGQAPRSELLAAGHHLHAADLRAAIARAGGR